MQTNHNRNRTGHHMSIDELTTVLSRTGTLAGEDVTVLASRIGADAWDTRRAAEALIGLRPGCLVAVGPLTRLELLRVLVRSGATPLAPPGRD